MALCSVSAKWVQCIHLLVSVLQQHLMKKRFLRNNKCQKIISKQNQREFELAVEISLILDRSSWRNQMRTLALFMYMYMNTKLLMRCVYWTVFVRTKVWDEDSATFLFPSVFCLRLQRYCLGHTQLHCRGSFPNIPYRKLVNYSTIYY